uniref:Uncharacterized protein n=1 Tax=Avena sativa TaxID=4498 RepID=A0ACD5XA52_AVESA
MEEHGWRFEQRLPTPKYDHESSSDSDWDTPVLLRERKPLEVRNARRQIKLALRQKAARRHAEVALRKYNRTNNTKFELVEVKVISIFFECGAGCIHYNFTAKQPEDHNPADDAGVPKLFFSELDHRCRNEDDVMLCCIVGENDGTAMAAKTTSLLFTQVAKHKAVVVLPLLISLVQMEIAQTVIID